MVEALEVDEENPEFSFDLNSIGIAASIIRYEEGTYLETAENLIPIDRSSFKPNIKYQDPIEGYVVEIPIKVDQYMKIMEIFDMLETNNKSNEVRPPA
jgi:hypothetical protein